MLHKRYDPMNLFEHIWAGKDAPDVVHLVY